MTLRAKTVVILAITFVGLLVVVYEVASRALLRGFERLEEENLRRGAEAVVSALADEGAAVDAVAARWARARPGAEAPAGSVVPPPDPGDAAVDLVAVADGAGSIEIVASSGRDGAGLAALARELAPSLAPGGILARHTRGDSGTVGVLTLPSSTMLVASRPRLRSDAEGAAAGAVVAGRVLDTAAAARISGVARESVSIRRWDDRPLPGDFAVARAELVKRGGLLVRPLAEGWIAGYRAIDDVAGKPALIVRVDAPRTILMQGRASLAYLMASLVLVAIVFVAVPFVVLDRTVLRRLAWVSGGVKSIGASGSASARLPVGGHDELASLASRINEMLAALERAQGERGESESRYRAVFEQAGDGIVLFEAETGRVLDANHAAHRMLGYGPGELLDRSVHDLAVNGASAVAGHVAAVQSERRVYVGQVEFRRKEGGVTTGEVISSLVAMRGRDVICTLVRDTSERRKLEERLRRSQQLEGVGRLASGVAHDFNNLLQSVVAAVGVLRARGDSVDARERAAATLDAQVASGAALTRQLLLLARQEAYAPVALDLNAVIGDVSDFLRRVVRENIRLEVELAAGPLPTVGDRARLEQSVINLVANASEAMPEGGRITVAAGRNDGAVWFEVRDSGPGVAAEVRESVFEPFFTTKDVAQHAGLGLTVVRRIVKEHGGSVAITGGSGAGTTFRVTLPGAAVATASTPATVAAVAARGRSGRARILLVEDGEETRRGLCEMLTLLDHDVVAVASAEEAEARSDLDGIDLLLTDFMLPGSNGAELARELLGRRPRLPVIIMSGYAAEDVIRAHVEDEGVRFLPKPFGMEALAREVRAALESVS